MKVLLDENIPRLIVEDLREFNCDHVINCGWSGVKNGRLLSLAEEAGFTALITFDASIPRQSDLRNRRIGVLILKPEGQGLVATRALLPKVRIALASLEQGTFQTVTNRQEFEFPEDEGV